MCISPSMFIKTPTKKLLSVEPIFKIVKVHKTFQLSSLGGRSVWQPWACPVFGGALRDASGLPALWSTLRSSLLAYTTCGVPHQTDPHLAHHI